jgi:regulatory protein
MNFPQRQVKTSDPKQAYLKASRYCGYRDRSLQETKRFLEQCAILDSEETEQIIAQLLEEGFIDEKRFAESFARGKFNTRNWGRVKIRENMKQKGLNDTEISAAFAISFDEETYIETLKKELYKKAATISPNTEAPERYRKLLNFALHKGYESDLVRRILPSLINDLNNK